MYVHMPTHKTIKWKEGKSKNPLDFSIPWLQRQPTVPEGSRRGQPNASVLSHPYSEAPPNNKTLSLGTRSYVKAKATHVIGNSLVINQNLGEHPAFLIASELAYPSQGFDTEQDKYLRVAVIPHKLKCRVKRQQKKKNSWPQPSLLQASISPHSPHLKTSLLIDHWFLHSLSWPKF